MSLVVLFDIDGTLIDTGGAGGTAMRNAFRKVFGVERPSNVPYSGRTDRNIGGAMLTVHGLEDNPNNWDRLRSAYLEELAIQLPQHDGRTLAGVESLIEELQGRPETAIGLLTGNLRRAATLKLSHYGLAEPFTFGGFGDDHHSRDRVAQAALEEAMAVIGGVPSRCVVVGDTPHDVTCARAIEAEVIAVSTGIHPRDELAEAQPDLLVDDLTGVGSFFARSE